MKKVGKYLALGAVVGLIAGFGCTKKAPAPAPAEEEKTPAVEETQAPAPETAAPAEGAMEEEAEENVEGETE